MGNGVLAFCPLVYRFRWHRRPRAASAELSLIHIRDVTLTLTPRSACPALAHMLGC